MSIVATLLLGKPLSLPKGKTRSYTIGYEHEIKGKKRKDERTQTIIEMLNVFPKISAPMVADENGCNVNTARTDLEKLVNSGHVVIEKADPSKKTSVIYYVKAKNAN